MIITVQEARHVAEYRVWLRFSSGESGEVDLKDLVFKYAAAAPLREVEKFSRFYLDSWPTLAWDCGFDVSPETLYERLTGKAPAWAEAPTFRPAA
ncbi:MAG: DUF2442 domain-containing protein [Sulfuricellaceae bacterium]|jgi:hypothetical protein